MNKHKNNPFNSGTQASTAWDALEDARIKCHYQRTNMHYRIWASVVQDIAKAEEYIEKAQRGLFDRM